MDEDNNWNINIANAIPIAFVKAVETFNTRYPTSLGTTWPLFLNENSNSSSWYWRNINDQLSTVLKQASVIQTRSGIYRAPSDLKFLEWAHDRHGRPIFDSDREYVSSKYPSSVFQALRSLGVRIPNWNWICAKLRSLQNAGTLHGTHRTNEWYSDLAKVILSPMHSQQDRRYATDLRSIPLIPLEDGTWWTTPSQSNPIYFPASLGTVIPPGLSLTLVEREACNCPHRTKLFKLLGVKDCDVNNIVQRILDHHRTSIRAGSLDIVAQVQYLYLAKDYLKPGNMNQVWFLCDQRTLNRQGYQVYIDVSTERELRQLFTGYDKAFFLSSMYFQGLDSIQKDIFIQWLKKNANIATFPRLRSGNTRIHEDFRWLLQNRPDEVLDILRKHWGYYKSQLSTEIRQEIEATKFHCHVGYEVSLRETFIPLPSLLEISQRFCYRNSCSFLNLPDDEPSQWTFLSRFGVGVKEDIDFYLWILEQLGFKIRANVEKAKSLYLKIQSHYLRSTFENRDKIQ